MFFLLFNYLPTDSAIEPIIYFIEEIFVGFLIDLRTAVLGFIDLGNSVKLACKTFSISRSSIQRWRNKQTNTGVLDSEPRKKIPYKFDVDALKEYLKDYFWSV